MDKIEQVSTIEKVKAMADARRLPILQKLMAGPATVSQLGRAFGRHPAWIRHHVKQLEEVGLVRLASERPVRGFTEKYYQAVASAFAINFMVMPAMSEEQTVVALGSHDLALDLLSRRLHKDRSVPDMLSFALGSLDGLIALQQGIGHLAGSHLLDAESNEFNRPYVRHLFPGRQMVLITLAHRQQGLIVAPGNPLEIREIADLSRAGVRLVNRNRGSGTRLWLDQQLRRRAIPTEALRGYDHEVSTHTEVAEAVQSGRADAGVGLLAAARMFGLEFIPLFQERYDLVIPQEHYESPLLRPLLDLVQDGRFRHEVEGLGGYEVSHTGDEMRIEP